MGIADLLTAFIRVLGLAALMVYGYSWLLRLVHGTWFRNLAVGGLFGLGGMLTMNDPLELSSGVFYDGRNVLLALAPMYSGIWGAVVAALIMAAFRIYMGGVGLMPGLIGMVSVVSVGYLVSRIPKRYLPGELQRSFALAASVGACVMIVIFANHILNTAALRGYIAPVIMANMIGVLVLGDFFRREMARLRVFQVLQQEATVDPLTNLRNRRGFETAASQCLHHLPRTSACSVIMLDIDHFKHVNDTFGHDAGDKVLVAVAGLISGGVRQSDIVARYGGEEVAILMPGTRSHDAVNVAEKVRSLIEQASFETEYGTVRVTASLGVAAVETGVLDIGSAIKAADEALYRAKSRGRNRVERFDAVSVSERLFTQQAPAA